MPQANLQVRLLNWPTNPDQLVYLAAKRCYSAKSNDELELDSMRISNEAMDDFVEGVIGRGHLSVIEHATFTFMIEGVSTALLGQIVRHRLASFSVQSQRYVCFDNGFDYIIPETIMGNAELCAEFHKDMAYLAARYQRYIDAGIPAEDARYILPRASETKMIVTMNARELLHIFSLRCCTRAQWEIRNMANAMLGAVKEVAPSLFVTAGPACEQTGVCPEGRYGCGRVGR